MAEVQIILQKLMNLEMAEESPNETGRTGSEQGSGMDKEWQILWTVWNRNGQITPVSGVFVHKCPVMLALPWTWYVGNILQLKRTLSDCNHLKSTDSSWRRFINSGLSGPDDFVEPEFIFQEISIFHPGIKLLLVRMYSIAGPMKPRPSSIYRQLFFR